MKLRSFRLRLALISAASAAIGLFVFGLVASSLWRKDRVTRLDEELTRRGHVLASLGRSKEGWDKIYQSMESMVGEEKIDTRFLVVRKKNGTPFYTSNTWPESLTQRTSKHRTKTLNGEVRVETSSAPPDRGEITVSEPCGNRKRRKNDALPDATRSQSVRVLQPARLRKPASMKPRMEISIGELVSLATQGLRSC